jgi:HlyD family secretion protein
MNPMKAARNTLFLVVGLSLCIGVAGYWLKTKKTVSDLRQQLAEAKTSQQSLLDSKLTAVRTGDVRVQGKIEAAEAIALSPQVEAPILRVFVREGEVADAGQVLIELDDTGLRARLADSTSAMHDASRRLQDIERLYPNRETLYRQAIERVELTYRDAVASFQKALEDSEREVARCKVEAEGKRLDVERMRKLASENLVSQAELDQAELAVQRAKLDVEQAQSLYKDLRRKASESGGEEYVRLRHAALELEKALQRVEEERITDGDLAEAQTALEQCQLTMKLAEEHVAAAKVRAPIRGVVTAANDSPRLTSLLRTSQVGNGRALSFEELGEVGKRIGPEDILLVIEGLDQVVVKVDVDEMDINRIEIGDAARIAGVGFADKPLKGEVVAISPKATYVAEGITTFETTVKIFDELGKARLGMSAEVDIVVGGKE